MFSEIPIKIILTGEWQFEINSLCFQWVERNKRSETFPRTLSTIWTIDWVIDCWMIEKSFIYFFFFVYEGKLSWPRIRKTKCCKKSMDGMQEQLKIFSICLHNAGKCLWFLYEFCYVVVVFVFNDLLLLYKVVVSLFLIQI